MNQDDPGNSATWRDLYHRQRELIADLEFELREQFKFGVQVGLGLGLAIELLVVVVWRAVG